MSNTLPAVPSSASQNAATDIPVTGEAATLDADRYLGEVLLREELVTQAELDEAFEQQKQDPYQPLGKILVEQGANTERQLKHLLGQRPQYRIGELLVRSQVITSRQLEHALEQQKHLKMPLGQVLLKLKYLTQQSVTVRPSSTSATSISMPSTSIAR